MKNGGYKHFIIKICLLTFCLLTKPILFALDPPPRLLPGTAIVPITPLVPSSIKTPPVKVPPGIKISPGGAIAGAVVGTIIGTAVGGAAPLPNPGVTIQPMGPGIQLSPIPTIGQNQNPQTPPCMPTAQQETYYAKCELEAGENGTLTTSEGCGWIRDGRKPVPKRTVSVRFSCKCEGNCMGIHIGNPTITAPAGTATGSECNKSLLGTCLGQIAPAANDSACIAACNAKRKQ